MLLKNKISLDKKGIYLDKLFTYDSIPTVITEKPPNIYGPTDMILLALT